MTREEKIKEFFSNEDYIIDLEADQIIDIHNDICEWTNEEDEKIYKMEDFSDIFDSADIWSVACMIGNGDFNPNHPYFWINGYGNIISAEMYFGYNDLYEKCHRNIEWYANFNPVEFFEYLVKTYNISELEDDEESDGE